MGAFGGWEMPIDYGGTVAEHHNVRARAGLFDVSHLGKLLVTGARAREFLDAQLTNRMTTLDPGRARYTLICDEEGGILDDLIVYALAEDELLVVPNASNRDAVAERLRAAAPDDVAIAILDWSTIAVQGPASPDVVCAAYPAAKGIPYMRVVREGDVVVARSGYTGEVGYEIFTAGGDAAAVWEAMLAGVREAGGGPCGLAARDTLRLEMGYPLHGNDIDLDTTPAEAGLMWAVALKGRTFPGSRAIAERPVRKKLTGLRMLDRRIPRRGQTVVAGGRPVGVCTSGTFSPTLQTGIALAALEPDVATVGNEVEVDVRGKPGRARIVEPPFVDRSPK